MTRLQIELKWTGGGPSIAGSSQRQGMGQIDSTVILNNNGVWICFGLPRPGLYLLLATLGPSVCQEGGSVAAPNEADVAVKPTED